MNMDWPHVISEVDSRTTLEEKRNNFRMSSKTRSVKGGRSILMNISRNFGGTYSPCFGGQYQPGVRSISRQYLSNPPNKMYGVESLQSKG